jgi:hypothetical protein
MALVQRSAATPMKRLHCLFQPILVLVTLSWPCDRARGDYLIFHSGKRAEGKIVSEDAHSVTFEYQLGRNRGYVFPKSELAQIVRETPAQLEFRAKQFEQLLPSRDLMSVADYQEKIEYLQRFIARFPGTPEAKRAQDIIAALTQEQARVQAGELKVESQWWDAPTVKREKYEIDAYRHRFAMKEELANKFANSDLPREIVALREFEELRTAFPASLHYLKAIPEALDILASYDRRLESMAKKQSFLSSERQKSLLQLRGSSDEARVLNAIAKEKQDFEDRRTSQIGSGIKWRDVFRYDLPSLQQAQETVAAEKQSLEAIDLRALQFENENLGGARRCLIDGKDQEADTFLARLRPVKSTLVNRAVFDELEKMLATKQAR